MSATIAPIKSPIRAPTTTEFRRERAVDFCALRRLDDLRLLDLLGERQQLLVRRLRVERLAVRGLRRVELARDHELVERREACWTSRASR